WPRQRSRGSGKSGSRSPKRNYDPGRMKLDHVNIATPDAEGVAALFSALFGLPIVKRTTVADQGVKVLKLDAGNSIIELTEPTGPDTPVGRFLAKNKPGLHHLCFAVKDVRASVRELK